MGRALTTRASRVLLVILRSVAAVLGISLSLALLRGCWRNDGLLLDVAGRNPILVIQSDQTVLIAIVAPRYVKRNRPAVYAGSRLSVYAQSEEAAMSVDGRLWQNWVAPTFQEFSGDPFQPEPIVHLDWGGILVCDAYERLMALRLKGQPDSLTWEYRLVFIPPWLGWAIAICLFIVGVPLKRIFASRRQRGRGFEVVAEHISE